MKYPFIKSKLFLFTRFCISYGPNTFLLNFFYLFSGRILFFRKLHKKIYNFLNKSILKTYKFRLYTIIIKYFMLYMFICLLVNLTYYILECTDGIKSVWTRILWSKGTCFHCIIFLVFMNNITAWLLHWIKIFE